MVYAFSAWQRSNILQGCNNSGQNSTSVASIPPGTSTAAAGSASPLSLPRVLPSHLGAAPWFWCCSLHLHLPTGFSAGWGWSVRMETNYCCRSCTTKSFWKKKNQWWLRAKVVMAEFPWHYPDPRDYNLPLFAGSGGAGCPVLGAGMALCLAGLSGRALTSSLPG